MSLLIEALRQAEAAADAKSGADANRRQQQAQAVEQARVLLAAGRSGESSRARILGIAAVAFIGAACAAAVAWWLTRPPSALSVVAAAPDADPPRTHVDASGEAAGDAEVAAATPQPRAAQTAAGRQAPAQRRAAVAAAARPPAPTLPAQPPGGQLVQPGVAMVSPLPEAYAAWKAGRLDDAQRLYQAALALDPRSPDALLGLAAIAESRGELAAAVAYYRRVLALEPEQPVALAALAELSVGADAATHESVLRQALARRPNAAALHVALGRLLAAQDRWSEAHRSFAAAWQAEPNSAERAYDLAVALDRLRKAEAAAEMYARALALASPAPGFDADAARARLRQLQAHLLAASR